MKRALWIIPAILLLSISARAQDMSAWEITGGYSYLRADINGSNFSLNGGGASATQNVNNWFGGRFELNAYHGVEAGTTVAAQTFTWGPVFSYRHFKTFNPYTHFQLGAVHASEGYLGISQSAFKFAMVGGAGVDVRVNRYASVRVQADYLLTRFLGLNQNNIQGSVGLVLHFGKKSNPGL
jgi:hypothetical protein